MTPESRPPMTYTDMAFRLVAKHGVPAIVLGGLLLWLLGAFAPLGWESPMSRIEKKLDYVIWLEQAICRRVFRGETDRLRWLGCTQKEHVAPAEEK